MAVGYYFVVLVLCFVGCYCELCPKKCDCDMNNGLKRAMCVDQSIVSIDLGVPKALQVYILSHNVISELDNFCFKEAGYVSLQTLDLSYNLIFWIGLHAFSGLEELVHLDLSNNRLRHIPPDLFWETPKLTNLDLSSNVFESLKNVPFLMHTSLQVLNLNNCRMAALPHRLFTRLPNLRKLDLSENFVMTLSTQVLAPLKRLERIELKNDFMKCSPEVIEVESWIISQGITYQKHCKKLGKDKMSEKMISVVTEKKEIDVNEVWNITTPEVNLTTVETTTPMTPIAKFDRDFSAIQAFVIGIEIGLAFGIVGAYIWLKELWRCGKLTCTRPLTRRQNRRLQRIRDNDMRASLLWSNVISPDLDTPPSYRRELSLPDRSPPRPAYAVQVARQAGLHVDAIRLPDREGTPPPPYHECRINI